MTATLAPPESAAARIARPGLILFLACVAQFMLLVDDTITNVALPTIAADLGFSESSLSWVVNAYLLTFGGFLLIGGRLADRFGPRRMFSLALTGFAIASAVCGLAQDDGMLIAARAAQGIMGALLSPAALAILLATYPEGPGRRRAPGDPAHPARLRREHRAARAEHRRRHARDAVAAAARVHRRRDRERGLDVRALADRVRRRRFARRDLLRDRVPLRLAADPARAAGPQAGDVGRRRGVHRGRRPARDVLLHDALPAARARPVRAGDRPRVPAVQRHDGRRLRRRRAPARPRRRERADQRRARARCGRPVPDEPARRGLQLRRRRAPGAGRDGRRPRIRVRAG